MSIAVTLCVVGACKGDEERAAPPLVEAGAERREERTTVSLPPQPFASETDLERFVAECTQAEEERSDKREPKVEVGVVYRGTKPVTLPALPDDNVFRWTQGNPRSIDPSKISESAGNAIASDLFEPLLVKSAGNAPAQPAAAHRYEVSEDGRTYTFHLRQKMQWSDGHPVTAHDYVYGWKRALAPETGSRTAQQLWIIEGAQEYSQGKVKAADGVGVRALDDLTLEVRLIAPAPYFPDLITFVAFSPLPRWAVEAHGAQWTRPDNIVTNGPFRLDKWLERDRFELVKSPTFWDADNIALSGVIVFITDNEGQDLTLYESGQTHVAHRLSPSSLQQAIKEGRNDLRIDTNACVYYYGLRIDRPPFDDSRVRLALNLALDKDKLVSHVLGSFQTPASTFVPPMLESFMGYRSPELPARDPAQATRLMAAAGYPSGKGFPETEILYNTSEGHKRIAEFVSRNWQETLGISLAASNMEWKSLLQRTHAGDFAVARGAWCADYPDPLNYLEIFHSDSDNNTAGYLNPAYDAIVDRARAEPDPKQRLLLLCAAEKALGRDLPFVPVYQYTVSALLRPEVKGYLPQYQDHHLLRWISLERAAAPREPER